VGFNIWFFLLPLMVQCIINMVVGEKLTASVSNDAAAWERRFGSGKQIKEDCDY
jgi:hypothetical protein